ncbi:5'-methylthioadenosine/S-adenosylhomocysteine nucleosidase [Zostera marina]|uniref:5'-methylthioadenosine/S-adenosylhomocysteine nucleosidase n=1 Tax=Zostera marina TaxID=29655 RepID=A0A0K9PHU1_ZOSMR|nr:5'-methylthioadenosine/S-adenosylhomocysteine nucleosidase [Zostera marina]
MVSPTDTSDVIVTADAMLGSKSIATIVIIIAMQKEALPLVTAFKLSKDIDSSFPDGVPWVWYHGMYKDLNINILCPRKDPVFGVDSVGTVSASLLTYASVQALKPDLIINAGTAGGFKAKGANICDCYIASGVAFHDRRNPIPAAKQYGIGLQKSFATPNLISDLNLKVGKLSTGDSLDMSEQDYVSISANDAVIKDMEAFICWERR